jgi:hypothetical protein
VAPALLGAAKCGLNLLHQNKPLVQRIGMQARSKNIRKAIQKLANLYSSNVSFPANSVTTHNLQAKVFAKPTYCFFMNTNADSF